MSSIEYRLDQWSKIYKFLPRPPCLCGKESNCRLFMGHPLDCPKWAQWRLLPKEYGPGIASINVSTLGRQGVWERMFTHFSKDTDLENVSIDGSVIRAIPAAAKKKKNKKSVKPRQNSTWTF